MGKDHIEGAAVVGLGFSDGFSAFLRCSRPQLVPYRVAMVTASGTGYGNSQSGVEGLLFSLWVLVSGLAH